MADAALIIMAEGDAPASPAAGSLALYSKVDNKLYKKDSTGTEEEVGGGGAGFVVSYSYWD